MNRSVLILLLLSPGASSAAEDSTRLEAETRVPVANDACLDHSVRELGMSAKRQDADRRWKIGPQYLHPSVVAGGAIEVTFQRGEAETSVRVVATWSGGAKPAEVQREVESRLTAMAAKLAQICGVVQPKVDCRLSAPGASPAPCAPAR